MHTDETVEASANVLRILDPPKSMRPFTEDGVSVRANAVKEFLENHICRPQVAFVTVGRLIVKAAV